MSQHAGMTLRWRKTIDGYKAGPFTVKRIGNAYIVYVPADIRHREGNRMTITGWVVVDKHRRQCKHTYARTRRDAIWRICDERTPWRTLYRRGYRCVKLVGEI